jgi:hypothetical protein
MDYSHARFPGSGGFASLRRTRAYSSQFDALGAWVASQDDGEIPFQVLQFKEVQALRSASVKEGQLSAQGYEDLIKPVLAELEAYGKGGITTETLVQVLGFAGVISSVLAK